MSTQKGFDSLSIDCCTLASIVAIQLQNKTLAPLISNFSNYFRVSAKSIILLK